MKQLNLSEFEELCNANEFSFFIVHADDSSSFDFTKSFREIRFCSGTVILSDKDNYFRIKCVKSISVDISNSVNTIEFFIECDDLSCIDGKRKFTIIAQY